MKGIPEDEAKRRMIRDAWLARGDVVKSEFVKNMCKVSVFKRRTVYSTLKRIERNETMTRKNGSGRKIEGWSESKEMKMCHEAGQEGISYRMLGKRFGINGKTVKKILKRNGVVLNNGKSATKVSAKRRKIQKP